MWASTIMASRSNGLTCTCEAWPSANRDAKFALQAPFSVGLLLLASCFGVHGPRTTRARFGREATGDVCRQGSPTGKENPCHTHINVLSRTSVSALGAGGRGSSPPSPTKCPCKSCKGTLSHRLLLDGIVRAFETFASPRLQRQPSHSLHRRQPPLARSRQLTGIAPRPSD